MFLVFPCALVSTCFVNTSILDPIYRPAAYLSLAPVNVYLTIRSFWLIWHYEKYLLIVTFRAFRCIFAP